MAQFNWTYVGDTGRKYNVGLYHGTRTGHLLIHCNSRIMLIDFGVLQSSTYSFFLEEELCEIKLERKGNKFFYHMLVNREADTPRNRLRKARDKKHWRQSLLFFGGLFLCVAIFITAFFFMRHRKEEGRLVKALENMPQNSIAKVFIVNNDTRDPALRYSFVADGRTYNSKLGSLPESITELEMPLESGDEFKVEYVYGNPQYHQIDFGRPSDKQLERYFQRALDKHAELHPNESLPFIECQLSIAYELQGLSGIADFYQQDKDPQAFPDHNRNSYYRLVRDGPFRDRVQERCWSGKMSE